MVPVGTFVISPYLFQLIKGIATGTYWSHVFQQLI